jgi:hypothetical protein
LTSGSQCWCGNSIPANQVTPDHCSLPCPGYPSDNCIIIIKVWKLIPGGGTGYLSVWLTGLGKLVGGAATDILTDTTARAGATKTSGAQGSNTVYITAGRKFLLHTMLTSRNHHHRNANTNRFLKWRRRRRRRRSLGRCCRRNRNRHISTRSHRCRGILLHPSSTKR